MSKLQMTSDKWMRGDNETSRDCGIGRIGDFGVGSERNGG